MLEILNNLLVIMAALAPRLAPLLFPNQTEKDLSDAKNNAQAWADRPTDDDTFAQRLRDWEKFHCDNGS